MLIGLQEWTTNRTKTKMTKHKKISKQSRRDNNKKQSKKKVIASLFPRIAGNGVRSVGKNGVDAPFGQGFRTPTIVHRVGEQMISGVANFDGSGVVEIAVIATTNLQDEPTEQESTDETAADQT